MRGLARVPLLYSAHYCTVSLQGLILVVPYVNNSHMSNVFGQNVRRRREELGLDIAETAARAEISRAWLSRIERGQREPYLSVALRLADVLHVDLCELLQQRH